jgi:hypothetical protein
MLKGILINALGHPYFGRYAYNLAVTIKAVEKIPICLVHDYSAVSHLTEEQLEIFDIRIPSSLSPSCGSKLHAYDLSPFEKTLVLDADMIWLPKHNPSDLFDSLEGIKFTAITEGSTDKPSSHYFFWGHIEEIREKYKIAGVVHQLRTEVMYFERDEAVERMFKKAQEIYLNPGLKYVKEFAGGVPDEMALNIAAGIEGIEPHDNTWKPSYWAQLFQNQIPPLDQLYREYYLLSAGGNINTQNVKNLYNTLVKAQSPKLGLAFCFPIQSKHSFLENRRKS